MEKDTRNTLRNMVTSARKKLETSIAEVLEGRFGIYASGEVDDSRKMDHLDSQEREDRQIILAHLDHIRSGGFDAEGAVDQLTREIAFTHLNRLVAFKLMEQRKLIREAVSRGVQSRGVEFYLVDHPEDARLFDTGDQETAYRHFLSWQAQQFEDEIAVLFSSSDPAEVVFPPQRVLDDVLGLINSEELSVIWTEDETIGWVYQYFTPKELREQARSESQVPRNSYELAFRNQFYTPRYVVEFLTDNTLGRIWYEMLKGETRLVDQCDYLVRRPTEVFLAQGEEVLDKEDESGLNQEELLQQPEYILFRAYKDPRRLKVLDPACGSGHFLLYAFDLLAEIFEEAWEKELVDSQTGECLHTDYESLEELRRQIPGLILRHNLHGIDIDRRAAQIAALALWLRAQRYFHEEGIQREKRVPIRQGNLVVAEPMPGDEELLEEFTDTLNPPLLGQLVRRVFDKMELAGEAGSLLKIEEAIEEDIAEARKQWEARPDAEQLDLFPEYGKEPEPEQLELFDVSQISDVRFWQQIEERLLEALRKYSKKAANGLGVQRQLFAEDAMGGFGFIDLMRKRYDVVLMNPPFGAPTPSIEEYITNEFKGASRNLFAAFPIRALDLSDHIGCITDRAFIMKYSYKSYRDFLYSINSPKLLADFGWGILDTANVETAAYVINSEEKSYGVFINLLDENKTNIKHQLLDITRNVEDYISLDKLNIVNFGFFEKLPHNALSHYIPSQLQRLFISSEQLEPYWGYAKRGMSSGKTAFACRLLWEVDPSDIGEKKPWNPVNVGGGEAAFARTEFMCFYYRKDWGKLNEFPGFSLKNVEYFWELGIGWGKRTDNLTTQIVPKGQISAEDGQIFIPKNLKDIWVLLGVLNSRYVQSTINTICGIHKGPGYLGKLPIPSKLRGNPKIEDLSKKLFSYALSKSYFDETSIKFRLPLMLIYPNHSIGMIREIMRRNENNAQILYNELDNEIFHCIFENDNDIKNLSEIAPDRKPIIEIPENDVIAHGLISYFVGCVFGRWDVFYALGKKQFETINPFDPISPYPPSYLLESPSSSEKEKFSDYPIDISVNGILPDDPNHPNHIIRKVREVISIIWDDNQLNFEDDILRSLNNSSLLSYFRLSGDGGFFMQHTKCYSKSRRKAPIYWYLQSRDKNYGLWLYYHRLDKDLLYKAMNNYVRPKVQQVQQRMEDLKIKAGEDKKFQEEFEEQENFYLELLDFQEKLQRAADLNLKPDLNDGVVLNIAPLHELVPWKEAEKYWNRLLNGKYEWSSIGKQLREKGLVNK